MLRITIPAFELYDEINKEFISVKEQTLQLEHSLVSLSKWESKWCKPFLTTDDKTKTYAESVDYIRCMTLTQNVNPYIYFGITGNNLRQVGQYIDAPMTATKLSNNTKKTANKEVVTAEIIYYRMIANNIPFECQKWHLNRLVTLINVCNIKNQPPGKKMSKQEILNRNAELNESRRRALNTKG